VEDESLTAYDCQNIGIVFKVKIQTSFRHSGVNFSKDFKLKEGGKSS